MKLKFIFFILYFAIFNKAVSAQNFLWSKDSYGNFSFTDASTEYISDVTTDSNNNIIACGWFSGYCFIIDGTYLYNSAPGNRDGFILKFDPNGSLLWAKTIGGSTGNDLCNALSVDPNGNIIVAGSFSDSILNIDNIVLNNTNTNNRKNIFLAKLDADGNAVWAKNEGCERHFVESLSTDRSGNIILSGNFSDSTIQLGNTMYTNEGIIDVFLAKYNNNGNFLWAKTIGGPNFEIHGKTACDIHGNIVFGCTFASRSLIIKNSFTFPPIQWIYATDTINSEMSSDIFTIKFNPAGNIQWLKSEGGSSYEYFDDLSIDQYGNTYTLGSFKSSSMTVGQQIMNNTDTVNGSSFDLIAYKYDSGGNPLWCNSYGGNSNEYGKSISADKIGNVFLTATYNSPSISFGSNSFATNGFNDILLARLNSSGDVLWSSSIGGSENEKAFGCTDYEGDMILAGEFNSPNLQIGSDMLFNSTCNYICDDIFISKISLLNSSVNSESEPHAFSVFPNPAQNLLNLSFSDVYLGENYLIYNLSGQLVMQGYIENLNFAINIEALTVGYYFIKCREKVAGFVKNN